MEKTQWSLAVVSCLAVLLRGLPRVVTTVFEFTARARPSCLTIVAELVAATGGMFLSSPVSTLRSFLALTVPTCSCTPE